MDIYFLGWICSFLLLIFLVILIIQKKKLNQLIYKLNQHHEQYVTKQIIDLRSICHNINTPISSIITVLEIFNLNLYGDLPEKYVVYAQGATEAIEDLKKNIKDIQSYCNYYAEKHTIKIKDTHTYQDIDLKNPYVINI